MHSLIYLIVYNKCLCILLIQIKSFVSNCFPPYKECYKINKEQIQKRARLRNNLAPRQVKPQLTLYNRPTYNNKAISRVLNSNLKSRLTALIIASTTLRILAFQKRVKQLAATTQSNRGKVIQILKQLPLISVGVHQDIIIKGICNNIAHFVNI